jgi:ribosomal protein L11 methyltransferase
VIKTSLPLLPDRIQALEDALYEIAPNNWSLTVNSNDGNGKIEGYFDSVEDANQAILYLESIWGESFDKEFNHEDFVDKDWTEAYKIHFKPWSHGIIHWVPEWEKENYSIPSGHRALYLDPGMAFGTGNHETTRLCLKSMIQICKSHQVKDFIDIGCGSGILSLSANLLGIKKLKAIDFDPDAIKVAKDNAKLNSVGGDICFQVQSVEQHGTEDVFDLVVANIQADILMQNSRRLIQQVRTGGFLVLSGILEKEIGLVKEHFISHLQAKQTNYNSHTSIMGEWALLQINLMR